jgi:multiple sugar transport system substrate-binding protein
MKEKEEIMENRRWQKILIWVFFFIFIGAAISPALAQKVTLKMVYPGWDSKKQEEAVTSLMADFSKENPNIAVEIISIPWPVMHQKLIVSLRSGDVPDIGYLIVRFLEELQAAGFLADLTPKIGTLNKGDWVASTWEPATVGGKVYAVCDRVDPYVVYYNKDFFEKAGIKSFPSTTGDFIDVAQKLTKGGLYGYGLVGAKHPTLPGQIMNFFYNHHANFLSADGKKAILNSEAGVAALEFYTNMAKKYKIAQPSAASDSRNEVRQLFMTGQVAMMIDGPWATGTFRDMAPKLNWGVGKIPQVPGKDRRSVLSAWYYTVFSGSKHKEEAWKLVDFLLRPENMAKGVVTLPVRQTAAKMPRFATPEWAPFFDAAQYAAPEPSTRYFNEIMDFTGEAIQEILLDRKTPKKAADDAAARIGALLK